MLFPSPHVVVDDASAAAIVVVVVAVVVLIDVVDDAIVDQCQKKKQFQFFLVTSFSLESFHSNELFFSPFENHRDRRVVVVVVGFHFCHRRSRAQPGFVARNAAKVVKAIAGAKYFRDVRPSAIFSTT